MGVGSRVRAKGEEIEFDEQKFKLVPVTNEQLIEVQEMASKGNKENETKVAMESLMVLAVHTLNNGLKEGESAWSVEEMKKSPTPFLMKVFEVAVKINKLETMFDFQQKSQASGHPTLKNSVPESNENIYKVLNQNPVKKLG
tara:strand:+ start:60 stop:485 length:426 start_codon:yes stop_codon:yes gene_type:complete